MNTDNSSGAPIFLDDDDGIPAELPLMVTRHTLSSLGLSLEILNRLIPSRIERLKPMQGHSDQLNWLYEIRSRP